MKRFLATLVAAMFAFSVCVPAFATSTYPSPSSSDAETSSAVEDAVDDVWQGGDDEESTVSKVTLVQAIVSSISGYSLSSYDLAVSTDDYTVTTNDDGTVTVELSSDVSDSAAVVNLMVDVDGTWVSVEVDAATGEVIGDVDEDVYNALVNGADTYLVTLTEAEENSDDGDSDTETSSTVKDAVDDVWYGGSDETSTATKNKLVQAISSTISGYSLSSYDLAVYGDDYTVTASNGTLTVSLPSGVSDTDVVYLMVNVNGTWVAVEIDAATGEVIGDLDEDVYYAILDGADTYLVVLTEAEEGSEGSEGSSSGSSSSSSSSSGSSSSSSSTSPKTDDINMAPYVTLCVLALAGAVVAGKKAFAK